MSTTRDATRDTTTARRPGRPRSAQADRAILDATLALFAELGYEGMSIEGIAARAGVGKTTIYRRWPSKEELLIEALGQIDAEVPVPYDGTLREDLIAMAHNALRFFDHSGGLFVRAIGEVGKNPAVLAVLEERIIAPRFGLFRARIERAIEAGELRGDVDLALIVQLLAGPVFFRSLIPSKIFPLDTGYPEQLIDAVLQGLAPR